MIISVSTSLNLLQQLVVVSSSCFVEEIITYCWTELLLIYELESTSFLNTKSYKTTIIIKNLWAINMEKSISYQTHMVCTNADMEHPKNIRDFSVQSDGDRCTKPKHWDYLLCDLSFGQNKAFKEVWKAILTQARLWGEAKRGIVQLVNASRSCLNYHSLNLECLAWQFSLLGIITTWFLFALSSDAATDEMLLIKYNTRFE